MADETTIKTFKKPIIISESIYSEAQAFENIDQVYQWAEFSLTVLDKQFLQIKNYFASEDMDVLREPFAYIVTAVKPLLNDSAFTQSQANNLAKQLQELINKTLAVGFTYAHPSPISEITQTYGSQHQYLAGFYSAMFELTWISTPQQFRSIFAQGYFQQGVMATQIFQSRHARGTVAAHRPMKSLVAKSRAEMKAVVTESNLRIKALDEKLLDFESNRQNLDMRIKQGIKDRLRQHVVVRNRYKEDLVKAKTDHDEQVRGIRDAFSSEIALKAPANYWKARASNSRWAAVGFGILFVLASCTFIYLAFKQGPVLYETMTLKAGENGLSLAAVAIFTFPVIVGLWMLKSAARLFVENLHFHQDASYRHMMITTYLSMLRDPQTPITADEREHALKAIFSSNPGKAEPITLPTDKIFTR